MSHTETRHRVTVEAFLHGATPVSLDDVQFLRDEKAGRVQYDADTTDAHVLFKDYLSPEEVEKVKAWAEKMPENAGSGKLVVLVDYQAPLVLEWHHANQVDRPWRQELERDAEGLQLFIDRSEHLLHMG